MKDEILKSYLTTFIEDNNLENLAIDEAFERFVNFNIISKLYPREFKFEDICTGGSNDLGLDGAAIIINGNIIKNETEVDFLIKQNGSLDVTFAFIQTKKSNKFKGDEIGTFVFGVKSIFDEAASIPENDNIQQLRKLKEKVYKESINFDELPELKLFFVTSGKWENPEPIVGRVKRELKEIAEKSLFRNDLDVDFYDVEKLKNTYREISRKTVKEIQFHNDISLPDTQNGINVRQSYIGCIPAKIYLELITNSDGELEKGLFYENIRDFQGKNKVNKEIEETLKHPLNQTLLPLLNNGITIISKKVEKVGTKIKLTDFQIVNGCQTSHVLFENRDSLLENPHIILKIIETTDQEITNKIIRATNRQTEVKDEAFESLRSFHKNLQEYYKAMADKVFPPIYYERRSKEYLGNTKVKQYQVITLSTQVVAYVSTKLSQPHSTHRYFGELLGSNRMFNEKDNFEDYYLSTLIINRLEILFRCKGITSKYKIFKYYITYITYWKLLSKKSNEFGYVEMINLASKKEELKPLFIESCNLIDEILRNSSINNRDSVRSKEFTSKINDIIKPSKKQT